MIIRACGQARALLNAKAPHYRARLREPDWIRTNGLLLRRQLLYPAELPVQYFKFTFPFLSKGLPDL